MKVTVFGTGYVGLVTGSCLADVGHDVLCIDIDDAKIERLRRGEIPIYEPGLADIVQSNVREGRLTFDTSSEKGVRFGEILMVAVGTPPDEDGSADLSHVLDVARSIGQALDHDAVVVDKSTVPVGTGDRVQETINDAMRARGVNFRCPVVSNPEFLKEGAAVEDFQRPDRIVVGTDDELAESMMRTLYAPYQRKQDRMIFMSRRSAELTKYAANAMLATRISFMNEMANLAERLGADIEEVRRGIGSDPRIGYSFLFPGTGFGGSCFPKDLKALVHTGTEADYPMELLKTVTAINDHQKLRLIEKAKQHFSEQPGQAGGSAGTGLKGRRFGLWGLAFKPNTDDMREAPARTIMEALWAEGAVVQAWDPIAMDECRRIYGARRDLTLTASAMDAATGVDALFIATEAKVFRAPNFRQLRECMNAPVIFDGRNLYDPEEMRRLKFQYYAIGRGEN